MTEGLAECASSPRCDARSEARTQGANGLLARGRLRTQHRDEQRGAAAQRPFRQTLRGRALAALLGLVLLAGCGGAREEEGTATLWVTRDRGAELIVDAEVDAGQSLMRALDGEVELETRYGGRFVQSINGLEGSLGAQRDWFWFVNGYEGDRSAAEYRLRDGDVAWLDYRRWAREGEARVVVGAFPEPFVHGYDGKRRRTVIRYEPGETEPAGRLAKQLTIGPVRPVGVPVPAGANVIEVRAGPAGATAELLGETAGDPVRLVLRGDPELTRRYSVP